MKLVHRYPILGSSQDPNEVKLRVKSGLLYLVPLVIAIAKMASVDVGDEEGLVGLVDMISDGAMYLTGAYATALQIWGWIRSFQK